MASIYNNIENATVTYEFEGSLLGDSTVTVVITCNDGYSFEGVPTGSLMNAASLLAPEVELLFTVDGNTATATGKIEVDEEDLEIYTNGSTKTDIKETTISNNITNCTETHTIDGENVNITLTANDDDNRFYNVTVSFDNKSVSVERIDNKEINITLEQVPLGSSIVINGNCDGVTRVENNVVGCVLNGLLPFYIYGDVVNLEAVANEGTNFDFAPQITFESSQSLLYNYDKDFELSSDSKKATYNNDLSDNENATKGATLTITGSTIPTKTITGYGSINVYCVTESILNEFAKARFIYSGTGDTSVTPDGDLGEYVNRLHKIYFPVGDVTHTTLKCGNTDTLIECDSVNDPIKHIDFGKCSISSISDSSNDFNSEIYIFIPFVGFMALDSDYMGKEIYLRYDIDIVSGEGIYNVVCDDVVILQGECTPVNDVIYRTSTTENLNTIGSDKFTTQYLRGLQPYVMVKYFEPLNKGNIYDTSERFTIGDVSGYARFEDVELVKFNSLKSERDEIINLLRSGIYL